jgi:RNase P/RNase MRP subunit POP5
MDSLINIWPHLSESTRTELIEHAIKMKTDTVYVRRKVHYKQRNSFILEKYEQLMAETDMSKKNISEKIAQEASRMFGETITAKAVQHVIYRSTDSPEF